MYRTFLAVAVSLLLSQSAVASKPVDYFYVYSDKGASTNHYIPSGWMGDYGDIKFDDANKENPMDGKTAIKITYSAKAAQGANWSGIYWQHPANNWGEKPGGFDLTGYKRLTVWARSDKPAKLAKFCVGGIMGDHGDSDAAEVGPIDLTSKWQKFTIDLTDKNLSHLVGGFCWAASRDDNQDGFTMYLDEIRFEK